MKSMSDALSLEYLASCDDRKLISLLRSGTENALAVLISRYMGLVRAKAGACTIQGYETDDIVQEGLIALLDAIKGYDAGADAGFAAYAAACIDNRIRKTARYAQTNKARSLNRSLPLDELDGDAVSSASATPEEIVIAKEKLDAVRSGVDTLLSDLERDVLFLYLDGDDYKQISQKIGISAKAVDNALQRVRRKLKQFQK